MVRNIRVIKIIKILVVLFLFALTITASFFIKEPSAEKVPPPEKPISRQWLEYAVELAKKHKLGPPETARAYAFVASVYADVLTASHSQVQASVATQGILQQLYPNEKKSIDTAFNAITRNVHQVTLDHHAQVIVDAFKELERTDGATSLVWDEFIPEGQGLWDKKTVSPFSPRAGEWKRWIIPEDQLFTIPPPPEFGSTEDSRELQVVKNAVAKRSQEWNKKITFWLGADADSPAGIWQDIYFGRVQYLGFSDERYGRDQKILAQTIADAVLESWNVKYTYWTARPGMRIANLHTSFSDTRSPGYVSENAAASAAAAEVLGRLVPQDKRYWQQMAQEARDSHLYAGTHFDIDNKNGFMLGDQVGKAVITQLKLGL